MNRFAAGADIGAREIYVAVDTSLDNEPVRSFRTFTGDLENAVAWLVSLDIKTLAMESTGVYWIPFAGLLEDAGITVVLANASHVKNVPGRKTDVCDAQWLQYLHSLGHIRGAFRPKAEVRAVRSLWRHRERLVRESATHIHHMQKALTQMNLQIHHVINDITGQTGTAIVRAILAGERNPEVLAQYRDTRIKASRETIVASLKGDYRDEFLFELKQSCELFDFCNKMMQECDIEIEKHLKSICEKCAPEAEENASCEGAQPPLGAKRKSKSAQVVRRAQLGYEAGALLRNIFRIDLTSIPGISHLSAQTLYCEVGPDLSAFPSANHFASWLGLCPRPDISGGKILHSHTRPTANRLARVLRMGAQSLHHAKNELGDYYRRMRMKLGGAGAVVATAHKLARILYGVLKSGKSYVGELHDQRRRHREREVARVMKKAKSLGLELVEQQAIA